MTTQLPFASWDRYRLEQRLGAGAMGEVYKAWDPVLGRHVALKFLHREDSDRLERFSQEARAQARIDHPNVCRVFEVGQVDGHPYIAMQFIDGRPVSRLGPEVTPEQKARIMQLAAEGVRAAHQLGLIHRDIKPANILVEKKDDGTWHPYIMDFGLVRDTSSRGATLSGTVVGTPAYMSPEQAQGLIHLTDRRTDIYSLGAAFYEVFVGRPPFDGDNPVQVMFNVIHQEPLPPRRVCPLLSADVENILFKCLEKDPNRRYDSARDLAEDLGLYLNGEPVRAKPGGWAYRLGKKIRKHKALTLVIFLAVIAMLATAGLALRAQWQVRQQALAAQRYSQRMNSLEAVMRYAHLLPLHDISRQKTHLQAEIRSIQAELPRMADWNRGPAYHALGSGEIALQEWSKAHGFLQRAWDLGYRIPETAFALGQVKWELYREASREAQKIPGRDSREAQLKRLEELWLKPAVQFLTLGQQSSEVSPAFAAALLALLQGSHDMAVARAGQAFNEMPWLYEAKLLESDIHATQAGQSLEAGDYAGMERHLDRSRIALEAAGQIARSDPRIYIRLSQQGLSRLELKTIQGQTVSEASVRELLAWCGQAELADPRHPDPHVSKAQILCARGEYLAGQGEPALDAFDDSIKAAQAALRVEPGSIQALNSLGRSAWRKAELLNQRGQDPRPMLELAAETYGRAIRIDPQDPVLYNNLAVANVLTAFHESDHGRDPAPFFNRALEGYGQAIAKNPKMIGPPLNRSTVYLAMAERLQREGNDPRPLLHKSIADLKVAAGLNPQHPFVHGKLGHTHEVAGEYELSRGLDPRPNLRLAVESYRRALTINPKLLSAYLGLGIGYLDLATYESHVGGESAPLFEQARQAYETAIGIDPGNPYPHTNLAVLFSTQARFGTEFGADPARFDPKTRSAFNRSIELNPNDYIPYSAMADLLLCRADWSRLEQGSPAPFLAEARLQIDRSLRLNPGYTFARTLLCAYHRIAAGALHNRNQDPARSLQEARAVIAGGLAEAPNSIDWLFEAIQVELEAARLAMDRQQDVRPFVQAVLYHQQALQVQNQGRPDVHLFRAQAHLLLALWQDNQKQPSGEAVRAGLEAAEKAIAINPRYARGLYMRGLLRRLAARAESDPAVRRPLEDKAAKDFGQAIRLHASLKIHVSRSFPALAAPLF